MSAHAATFPFGDAVAPVAVRADGPRPVFVLGAYPSALHVRWRPPFGRPVAALAVSNEPWPWWAGEDEAPFVDRWRARVGWSAALGAVEPAGSLNGSSGRLLDERVLRPLGIARDVAWICDCLDTFHASRDGATRIADTYAPVAAALGLATASLAAHPTETEIVEGALRDHATRLRSELRQAGAEVVVTLGNAAARTFAALVGYASRATLALPDYGTERAARVDGRSVRWLPLAHTAAPPAYAKAHAAWLAAGGAEAVRHRVTGRVAAS